MNKIKNMKGITMVSLVVTIIILLILSGVTIIISIGQNGIVSRGQEAKEESNKKTATELMNLKITDAQIKSYSEKQQMPTLAYLAAYLEEDKIKTGDIEYVNPESKPVATINESDYEGWDRIYTKLSKYPYEFEINSSLQLASIDGVKIANTQEDYEKLNAEVSKLKADLEKLNEQVTLLKNDNSAQPTYKPGDSITFGHSINSGFLTAANKEIYFSVPLGKDISSEVSNITVSSGNFRIRGVNGYLLGTVLNNIGNYFEVGKFNLNSVVLHYVSSSSLGGSNNSPVALDIYRLEARF